MAESDHPQEEIQNEPNEDPPETNNMAESDHPQEEGQKEPNEDPSGAFLSRPSIDKSTKLEENDTVLVAQSSMQGWRKSMEDVSVVLLTIPGDSTNTMFFGIFDGHGGTAVSEYVSTSLLNCIMDQPEWSRNLKEAIRRGFIECDQKLKDENDSRAELTGSTAVTVFIRGNNVYCGNVGDSRAISIQGNSVIPLSHDHKPTVPSEKERIIHAGGVVLMDRVNGSLGLSRAFGDFAYKRQSSVSADDQMVIAVPDVINKSISKHWQFIVMACDGIWEVMDNESVARFVRAKLHQNMTPAQTAESLMNLCLAPYKDNYSSGCDNMSVIIVQFKQK